MSDHSIISPQSPATAPAAVKDVMPVQEQLQNEPAILPLHEMAIQCKLTIGAVNDPLEDEADAMADTIMRMPEKSFIQRKCVHCEEEEKLQRKPLASFIQRKQTDSSNIAGNTITNQINSTKGSGSAMNETTKSFMESRFGADFSNINIHTNTNAAQLSNQLNAQAFTVENNIYFNEGKYSPESSEGKHLLAHELTHVIQQGSADAIIQKKKAFAQQFIEGKNTLEKGEESKCALSCNIKSRIQRSTKWIGATVHETVNPAEYLTGAADAPVTWQMLNGIMLKTPDDANGAMNVPTISTSGSGTNWKAKVDTVPLQEGGDDETVLAPGPWTIDAAKDDVKTAIGLAACSGSDTSTFTVHGKPSDNAVYKANRRHEDHHVADDKAVFNSTIKVWDKKVQKAKENGKEFKGTDAAAATAALWAAMGGTPKDIARGYRVISFDKGYAFHRTKKGGKMSRSNSKANLDCSIASIDIAFPS